MFTRGSYAFLLLLGVLVWPALVWPELDNKFWAGTVLAVNFAVLVAVWWVHTSPTCPFPGGVALICGSMMSGCANLTILYLPVVMAGVYLYLVYDAVLSIRHGREFAQDRWRALVFRFAKCLPDTGSTATPIGPVSSRPSFFPDAPVAPSVQRDCPRCKTFLTRNELEAGRCEACGERLSAAYSSPAISEPNPFQLLPPQSGPPKFTKWMMRIGAAGCILSIGSCCSSALVVPFTPFLKDRVPPHVLQDWALSICGLTLGVSLFTFMLGWALAILLARDSDQPASSR